MRKGLSVTPAIGATTRLLRSLYGPICTSDFKPYEKAAYFIRKLPFLKPKFAYFLNSLAIFSVQYFLLARFSFI
jgi:hypothetical protein